MKFSWRFILRMGLTLFAIEAVLLALAGLFYWKVGPLHRFYFSDILLIIGGVELATAGFGMLRNGPFGGTSGGGYGIPAFPVQPSESEVVMQIAAEFVQGNSFAVKLAISGLLTILAAAFFTYVMPA
jgi:hypothetical protein